MAPNPATLLFAAMCRYALNLPGDLALTWWEATITSTHPQVSWIARRLERYRGRPDSFKHYLAYVTTAIPPKALIESLEALHDEGFLDRKQTTDIEESLFNLMHQGKRA